MQTSTSNFFVGEWLVEPQLNRLTGKHGSAVVEPKVMEVLVHLAAHPGDVQTREQLLESVWEDTVVTDYVVSRSISKLRKVFDDSYRAPRYIETVSKTGYRLIAPVTHVDVAAEDAEEPVLWHGDSHPEAATGIEVVPALFQPRMGLPVARGRRRFWIGAGLTTVLLGMLAWLSIALTSSSPQEPPSLSPLTSFPGVEAYPTFSPDGSMIAFQGEGVAGQPDLFVRHVNAETVLRLTEDPAVDFSPAWSPDGAFVAFQRFSSDQCSLYVVLVFGGSERKLGDCPLTQRGLAWSPDGSWFAVTDREALDQPRRIYLVDPQSLERQPLTDPHTPLSDYYPRFSPDGQHVAFLRGGDLQITDLYVMPIDGRKAPRRLTFDDRHIARFSWTPDGRSLLFASSRSGDYRIWRISISGGEPEWFSEVGTLDPGGPTLASTRNQMAYEEWYHEINIWEVDLTDATQTAASGESSSLSRLFASTRWDFQPQFSPDGSQVVFVSNRSGHPELWIGQHDGSDATPLVSLEGAFLRMPRWSPDGKHIAFEAFVEGRSTVFVIDAKGGKPHHLTPDAFEHRVPSWSYDGQWVYTASNRNGSWQVWKVPVEGGEAVQVTKRGGYLALESPDGKTLYYSKHGIAGIWQLSAEGDETLLLPSLQVADWGNWAISDRNLFWIERETSGFSLARVDLDQHEVEHLITFSDRELSYEPGLTVSEDGNRVLLALIDRSESDIMLASWKP